MTVVALVGRGRIAEDHARAWTALGVELRWIVATSPGVGLDDAPGARVTTDLGEVLADADVDIVTIATPTPTHADIAIRSLEAGRHVLLEKPVAMTTAEADRIEAAAIDADRVLMVAQVVRFFPAYREIARLVEEGAVGVPIGLQSSRVGARGDQPAWMLDEAQSGGTLIDLGIHELDQVVALLGAARAVTARRMPGIDLALLDIETVSGATAQVAVGRPLPDGSPFTTGLRLWGAEGTVELAATGGLQPTVRLSTSAGVTELPVGDDDPFALQARHLIEVIAGRAELAVPFGEVRDALRLALAARDSIAAGGVRIPLE